MFVDGLSKLFSPPGPAAPQTGTTVGLSALAGVKGITAAIALVLKRLSGTGGKPLLILENPDFLLAALEGVGSLDMGDMILDLREVILCHICVCIYIMVLMIVMVPTAVVTFCDCSRKCRLAFPTPPENTPRDRACGFRSHFGSQCGMDGGAAAAGYGGCEGCQWGY